MFHHFPLNGHRFARAAALAGDCAAAQGRFAEMKEQLFARQDSFGLKPWREYAVAAGVDRIDSFDACLEARDDARIREGLAAGARIGVAGTPTVVVNGWKLARPPRLEQLREMAERAKRGESAIKR